MKFKKLIPNAFTLMNLSCGLLALINIFSGYYDFVFLFVCLGIFFDFWDGFFARKFNVQGELGVQLDSLADMVTSGVVPGVLMYSLINTIQQNEADFLLTEDNSFLGILPYLGFIITLASCYRLAKFNIDKRQVDSFIGLPTPANTLFIVSIPMIQFDDNYIFLHNLLNNPYLLLAVVVVSAFLLNSEIPLFSLKMKKNDFKSNKVPIFFVIYSALLLLLTGILSIPIIIMSYIVFSVCLNFFGKK